MRIVRVVFVLVAIVVMAQPVFACRECQTDCVIVQGHTAGCHFTQDGCTDGTPCLRPEKINPIGVQYSVASVEVTHSTPAVAPAREAARPVVASVAPARNINVR